MLASTDRREAHGLPIHDPGQTQKNAWDHIPPLSRPVSKVSGEVPAGHLAGAVGHPGAVILANSQTFVILDVCSHD